MPLPRFVSMSDDAASSEVLAMMSAFYAELDLHVDEERFMETIRHFRAHPNQGRIVLIYLGQFLAGYCILIPHWSNEYGGMVILLDELYIRPPARRQGVGRELLYHLTAEKPWNARTLILEVARSNPTAIAFYRSIGFQEKPNLLMTLSL